MLLDHVTSCLEKQGSQRVNCECPPNHDIIENIFSIKIKTFGNRSDPFRSERVFCIDEKDFTLTSTIRFGSLSSDA